MSSDDDFHDKVLMASGMLGDTGRGLGSGAACSLLREGHRKCLTEQSKAMRLCP